MRWDDAWFRVLELWPDCRSRALFVELVMGCRQKDCAYACRAQRLPIKTRGRMTIEAGRALLVTAPPELQDTKVVLYGTGDPGLLNWEGMRGGFDDSWISKSQVTMPADSARERLLRISKEFAADVRLSVSSLRELEMALAAKGIVRGICVPGSARVSVVEILNRSAGAFDVVAVRSTASDRDDYLRPEEFEQITGHKPTMRSMCKFGLVVHGAEFSARGMTSYLHLCHDSKEERSITVPYNNGVYAKPDDGSVLVEAAEAAATCTLRSKQGRWEWIS